MEKDFIDELIAERSRGNSRFPDLVAEAERRRAFARQLAEQRQARGLSQTIVAAHMKTAASVISKLEAGGDVKLSTLQRYCEVLGKDLSLVAASKRRPRARKSA
jgi:ribosome-binding protein aMBF1 (putative translation factor)